METVATLVSDTEHSWYNNEDIVKKLPVINKKLAWAHYLFCSVCTICVVLNGLSIFCSSFMLSADRQLSERQFQKLWFNWLNDM